MKDTITFDQFEKQQKGVQRNVEDTRKIRKNDHSKALKPQFLPAILLVPFNIVHCNCVLHDFGWFSSTLGRWIPFPKHEVFAVFDEAQ